MKRLSKIIIPTDLSEHSRRALSYGCWLAAEDKAAVVILHVTSEINVWELSSEFEIYSGSEGKVWPLDRILSEATLDLNHFLEPHLAELKQLPSATKRVVLGSITERITSIAEEEKADLIIMSPRRSRGLRHWLSGGITDRVTRLSPLPGLVDYGAVAVTTLAQEDCAALLRLAAPKHRQCIGHLTFSQIVKTKRQQYDSHSINRVLTRS